MSSQGDFTHLIDELNDTYLSLKRQKSKTIKFKNKKKMENNEMKCFYRELDRRKKYLITKLNNEIATLEWQWFQKEITDKEYVVAYDDIKRRIRELEG